MKILVLLPRFPYPLDKGDKLRAYHQMEELDKRHEVYLFALSHNKVPHDYYDQLNTICTAVDYIRLHWWEAAWGVFTAFLTGKPLQLGFWTSRRARRAFAAWQRQVQPDVVYCQMVRSVPTVVGSGKWRVESGERRVENGERRVESGEQWRAKYILDFQDALSLNTRRRMERSRGLMRLLLNYEYKALQHTEQQALTLFDATTVIATADRDAILSGKRKVESGKREVESGEWRVENEKIDIVPNGVDTEYFKIENLQPHPDNSRFSIFNFQFSICFVGNMGYAPNVDAARYLVEEIMPIVWERIPEATLLLAGADPKPAVKALASDRVTVSGRLPDIRQAYASSTLFVAPMRIGSGLQNKLLEAMSMHLPCVTTTLANAPISATAGDHLLVADTPAALASHIAQLLTSEELRNKIADGGHSFVQQHYSWATAVKPLEDLILNSQFSTLNSPNAQLESK